MMELGGEITRLDYEEVENEVKKAQEMAKKSNESEEAENDKNSQE